MMDATGYLITVKKNDNESVRHHSVVFDYDEAKSKMADLVECYDFGPFDYDRHTLNSGTTVVLSEPNSLNKGWIISMEKKRIIILDQ